MESQELYIAYYENSILTYRKFKQGSTILHMQNNRLHFKTWNIFHLINVEQILNWPNQ